MTDLSRLAAILDAYGAAPARWPDAERGPMLALLARDDAAGRLLAAAGELDDRLDAHGTPAPSPALRAAVMAGIPARPLRRIALWWAALGAVGIGLGGIAAGTAAAAALRPAAMAPAALHDDLTAFGGVAAEDGG